MQPKISVIVPVYKVELYLRQCIDSIIAQTYKNLEIILVDDGGGEEDATDNCGAICDEYASRDNRIIVIHKPNGGLSDARNAGLDIATGEYIGFVDSDDWIEPDMYETLYADLVNNDADIACCGRYVSYVNKNIPFFTRAENLILSKEEAIKRSLFSPRLFPVVAWDKLYKKYIFDNIRYPFGKIYEDLFVIIDVLSQANKIVLNTTPKYYYRQRQSSITKVKFDTKSMHMIEACKYNLRIIKEKYPNFTDRGQSNLLKGNIRILEKIIKCENYKYLPEYKETLSTLRKNFGYIMRSKFFTKKEKIKAIALQININLYKLIIVLNSKRKKNAGKILFE